MALKLFVHLLVFGAISGFALSEFYSSHHFDYWPFLEYNMFAELTWIQKIYVDVTPYGLFNVNGTIEERALDDTYLAPLTLTMVRKIHRYYPDHDQLNQTAEGLKKIIIKNYAEIKVGMSSPPDLVGFRLYRSFYHVRDDEFFIEQPAFVRKILVEKMF